VRWRLDRDPAFGFRRLEKALLALRFYRRFPRRGGAWPKYEYLKPWIADLTPAVVIDIGVNIGQFLYLAHRLWPDAQIIGIEPAAAPLAKVRAALGDDPRVTLHQCAAGEKDGEATLHVTRDDQNSSLLPPTGSFSDERPGDRLVGAETVSLRRMDGLLEGVGGPFFVKIDVQGTELDVLKGFGDRLADIETLIVEAPFERAYQGASSFDDLYRFLTANGFFYAGPIGTLTSRTSGRVRQEDAVFVRADGGQI